MKTDKIADRLIALCNQGKFEEAQKELYAPDAVSIESVETPGFPMETKGLNAIVEKGRKFVSMIGQLHSLSISKPVVAEGSFAFTMQSDITFKGMGRSNRTELCVYTVKNGKISAEMFYA